MRLLKFGAIPCFLLAAILSARAWGNETSAKSAVPGTLNYVEGQVSMGDEALNSKSIGNAELQQGESLVTEKGKAEVLLTPGVFLRIGNNSSVRMISPSITDTEIELDQGHAMLEVTEIHPENSLRVDEDGTATQLLKTGLYDFNRNQRELRVFDGKAFVESGREHVDVKGGRELTLASNDLSKARKFDKKSYEEGDLFRWSSLRSGYLAEANVDAAGTYAVNGWAGPAGWWGADWYWDPWFDAFTFVPGDGIFYSPFGSGFYSPWWVYQAPFFGYGYGWGRYGYGHYYHHFSTDARNWGYGSHYVAGRSYAHGIYHGPGSTGRGFHSGPSMASSAWGFGRFGGGGIRGGGGFHGSSGGFRGGGGGGGFHGGGGGFHGR
jgi:FecR-like protein